MPTPEGASSTTMQSCGLWLRPQLRQKRLCRRQRIQHIACRQPRPPKLRDPIAHLVQFLGRVRVGVHDDLAAELLRPAQMQIVQIGRAGLALCSTATPSAAARCSTCSMSIA